MWARLLLVTFLLLTSNARADDSARAAAVASYQEKSFAAAAGAFSLSYASRGEAADLFAWAQAERLAGQCERATRLYSLYLSTKPPTENRRAAMEGVKLCEGQVQLTLTEPGFVGSEAGQELLTELLRQGYAIFAEPWFLLGLAHRLEVPGDCAEVIDLVKRARRESSHPALAPLAERTRELCPAGAGSVGPTSLSTPTPPQPTPWYRERLAVALVATGGASVVAGGALLVLGNRTVSNADGPTFGDFADDVDRGRRYQWIGGGAVVVGGLVASLGLWRFMRSSPGPTVEAKIGGSATSLTLSWRH